MSQARDLPTELDTLVGRGASFTGKLHFDGAVRIDGTFAGEVRSDGVLVIGEGAFLNGVQIDVAVVIVLGGTILGDVRAKRSIELCVPAKVTGSLHAPEVMIEKGVQFEGNCRMAPMDGPGLGGT